MGLARGGAQQVRAAGPLIRRPSRRRRRRGFSTLGFLAFLRAAVGRVHLLLLALVVEPLQEMSHMALL